MPQGSSLRMPFFLPNLSLFSLFAGTLSMATICNSSVFLLSLFLLCISSLSSPTPQKTHVSFPLNSRPLSTSPSAVLDSSLSSVTPTRKSKIPTTPTSVSKIPQNPPSNSKIPFKYTMALVISLPVGTPPQSQPMVLDTGSQLSWIQCKPKKTPTKTPVFDPSLSSTFSLLPCNTPLCKPRIPDFSLPTSCDSNRLCHYSYFYADGTFAEGNLVREKISLSNSQSTPPVILGCSRDSSSSEGILGMNLGRLSFTSQAKIRKFSYCVPSRRNLTQGPPDGSFLIGDNPYSGGFKYVPLMRFGQMDRRPNLDKAAYTVGMEGIRIGGKRLDIPRAVFRPDSGGSGQTMVDSGTEFTFLVEDAYSKVKEEVTRLVGPSRLKRGYVYGGALDVCVDGDVAELGRLVGEMVLVMEGGVEIPVEGSHVWVGVGRGVSCLSVGSSQMLGVESNIIGNFHQQEMWVEFDVANGRLGFGKADCSKAL